MRDFPNYRVKRQDEDTKPGMIDTQIIVALRDADLVIADLSHLNPNAFYEIGIRHMIAKPIIHMQLDEQRIPFDLSLYKTVPFSFLNPSTYSAAQAMLRAQITEAIADGYTPDNPVIRALGQQHLKETASPELKVISDTLESLGVRLSKLENGQSVKPVVSLVSREFLISVQTTATDDEELGRIADEIVKVVPRATITRRLDDELHVQFSATIKSALEKAQMIQLISGVAGTSGPVSSKDIFT